MSTTATTPVIVRAFSRLPKRLLGPAGLCSTEVRIVDIGGAFELHFRFPEYVRHLQRDVEDGFDVFPRLFESPQEAVAFAERSF